MVWFVNVLCHMTFICSRATRGNKYSGSFTTYMVDLCLSSTPIIHQTGMLLLQIINNECYIYSKLCGLKLLILSVMQGFLWAFCFKENFGAACEKNIMYLNIWHHDKNPSWNHIPPLCRLSCRLSDICNRCTKEQSQR